MLRMLVLLLVLKEGGGREGGREKSEEGGREKSEEGGRERRE